MSILTGLVRRGTEAAKGGKRHEPNSGENNAFHGHGQGNEGIRSGRSAEARSVRRDELVAGFSIIQVKSLEEAIEWVKRAPNVFSPNGEAEVEIRKVMDVEDFGEAFTPNPEIAKVKIK